MIVLYKYKQNYKCTNFSKQPIFYLSVGRCLQHNEWHFRITYVLLGDLQYFKLRRSHSHPPHPSSEQYVMPPFPGTLMTNGLTAIDVRRNFALQLHFQALEEMKIWGHLHEPVWVPKRCKVYTASDFL